MNESDRTPLSADELVWAKDTLDRLTRRFSDTVVGQPMMRRALLVAVLSRCHVLLESVPGLAKTLAASTLARSVEGSFNRVQCTPDLLPSDIIGSQIFDRSTGGFVTELGPVHANFVLLDEINRSSTKTQSAMLEAMQERQTTIGGTTYRLPDPFVVLATQNPIEEEGTYVLPQAQLDRFLLKEIIDYPTADEEFEVLTRLETGAFDDQAPPACSTADLLRLQQLVRRVSVADPIKRYIVELVSVTRSPDDHLPGDRARCIEYGSSPRGAIAFLQAARASALLDGRDHAVPDDVFAMRYPVLRHRLILSFEALAERIRPEGLIDDLFAAVPTP
ncbi:AAA family ATPase [Tessaracoccus palaemonis]|uniref:MoxR family ATPase n=1 Tax=Tessaracoccus palaemonis TaxID=2829499 RepID=A0ABX8SJR0_9ACTN|nr:MoxR family ATPase [Tessaracoccus palaemonis]QXT63606.1 MoxR family ATPase [Tessaracoccus palaemonis]